MERKPATLLRAGEIREKRQWFTQRLNPGSAFQGTWLSRLAGLSRLGVSCAWIAPGQESFAYHAHNVEEEWIYILSGRGVVLVDGKEHEVGPGDFLGLPAPQVPHLLRNPGPDELAYLMGGQIGIPADVLDYPKLGKRFLLLREGGPTAFYELGEAQFPFGPLTERPESDPGRNR